jgi:hypothetical protein
LREDGGDAGVYVFEVGCESAGSLGVDGDFHGGGFVVVGLRLRLRLMFVGRL